MFIVFVVVIDCTGMGLEGSKLPDQDAHYSSYTVRLICQGTSCQGCDPKEPGQCLMTLHGDGRPGAPHESFSAEAGKAGVLSKGWFSKGRKSR